MSGILTVEPEGIDKRIHPRALEHFRKFRADVGFAVPLEEITETDLNDYLRDDEKSEFQRCMNEIRDKLGTCLDIADGDSPRGQLKPSLFELGTIIPMFSIKQLLKKVYGGKLKRIREQQKRMEEEERRHTAYRALNVPAADAEKYLTESREYEKFVKSTAGAVRAYMDKGESYTKDSRASDYLFYCDQIKRRKGEEQRNLAAVASARLFSYSLNEKIEKLKATLYVQKKSPSKYFSKDSRYIGQRFYALLSPDNKKELSDTIRTRNVDISITQYSRYYYMITALPVPQQSFLCLIACLLPVINIKTPACF